MEAPHLFQIRAANLITSGWGKVAAHFESAVNANCRLVTPPPLVGIQNRLLRHAGQATQFQLGKARMVVILGQTGRAQSIAESSRIPLLLSYGMEAQNETTYTTANPIKVRQQSLQELMTQSGGQT